MLTSVSRFIERLHRLLTASGHRIIGYVLPRYEDRSSVPVSEGSPRNVEVHCLLTPLTLRSYHSIYDSEYWEERYGDPTFSRHVNVAKVCLESFT